MLFVNNRVSKTRIHEKLDRSFQGSQFPHLDENQKKLIAETLTVHESDGINGSVQFQGRPIRNKVEISHLDTAKIDS
jgi:hypothetical protein